MKRSNLISHRNLKTSKKSFGFEAVYSETKPRQVWKKLLSRPHLFLLMIVSILLLLLGIIGCVLPILPGIPFLALSCAIFFYGANKFLE